MVDVVRYAEKFESRDGAISLAFPADSYEFEPSQTYRESLERVHGADYAHDFAGYLPWPKQTGVEVVRCVIWGTSGANADSQFDDLVSKCRRAGLGKLFSIDNAGTRRWCYAKLAERPLYRATSEQFFNIPVALRFVRLSDWYGASLVSDDVLITTSPQTFIVNNPGNAPALAVQWWLQSNTSAGFTAPNIRNTENGYSIGTSRAASSSSDVLRIDSGRMAVEYSQDGGTVFANDYALAVLGGSQVGLFRLEPGDNTIEVTGGGTPNFWIEWSFFAPYE
jgi:hypothetical protein